MPKQKKSRERERVKGSLSRILKVILTSLFTSLFCAGVIYAATTIGTNISTDGTLSATGQTTLGNASSTALSVSGNTWLGTTIISGGNLGIGTSSPYAKLSVVGETVASYFTATSTTATTTMAGGFNVGSGGLVYDFSSGNTSITGDLTVAGVLNFGGDLNIAHSKGWLNIIETNGTPSTPSIAVEVPAPYNLTATPSESGGTLGAGTYYYVVSACTYALPYQYDTTKVCDAHTKVSNEATCTISGSTGRCILDWLGGLYYDRVYGRADSQTMYWDTVGVATYTDTGSAGTAGTPPTFSTYHNFATAVSGVQGGGGSSYDSVGAGFGGGLHRGEFHIVEGAVDVHNGLDTQASNAAAYYTHSHGDVYDHFGINVDGTMRWGSGDAAMDVHLVRNGVGSMYLSNPISAGGDLSVEDTISAARGLFTAVNTTDVNLILKRVASQTSNILELQNESGTPMFYIMQTGDMVFEDNKSQYWGTGKDSAIWYDGTNMLLNTALAGNGVLGIRMKDASATPVASTRATKKWYFTKLLSNDTDDICDLGTDCITLHDTTTHGLITCFVTGTSNVHTTHRIGAAGEAVEVIDSYTNSSNTLGTASSLNIYDGGANALLINELGQAETIICEMTYD